MCRHPINEGGFVTLEQVVDTIRMHESAFHCDVSMIAVVGAVLRRPMWGKSLDLMAWQLGKTGERETLVQYRGTPLILPESVGAVCLPYPIVVPAWNPGIYGFELFDRDGCFGTREHLLATYLYAIAPTEPEHNT
jgi:hypothetical protein